MKTTYEVAEQGKVVLKSGNPSNPRPGELLMPAEYSTLSQAQSGDLPVRENGAL